MRRILVLTLILLVASCNQVSYADKPKPFLDKEKMAAVMTDLYLIESSLSTSQVAYVKTGIAPHKFIYKKHKIDSIIFQKNMAYYADRPELYKEILDMATAGLTAVRTELAEQVAIDKLENAKSSGADALKSQPEGEKLIQKDLIYVDEQ